MKRRWGVLVGLLIGAVAIVPLATAGAEAPTTTAAETPTAPEGSVPPGGTVNCTTAATLDPDHGPPGTEVTVTTQFAGNCDDVNPIFLTGMTCSGTVTSPDLPEPLFFSMTVDADGNATGTFTAPATEPNPPVVDAVEPLSVTVTCEVVGVSEELTEGGNGTTYVYPAATYNLELFADPDGDQPTLVQDDDDNIDNVDNGGVVDGTPTFTG